MGFSDWLENKSQQMLRTRIEKVAQGSAKTMMISVTCFKLANGDVDGYHLCKAAILGRPNWNLDSMSEMTYMGVPTGFIIWESTSLVDVIEHVVCIELLADPSLKKMPNYFTLVDHARKVVRAYMVPTSATQEAILTGTVTDIDGNVYQTVKIGDQWWMAENLKVTHYRNGATIPLVTSSDDWYNLLTGARCAYDNDQSKVATYGYLYNWYAVNDSRNIAPARWHVPTDAEWSTLVTYLGGANVAGGKMKEIGTTNWHSPNTGATNESGFAALPGGYRPSTGYFDALGNLAYFWSSTEISSLYAWSRRLYYDNAYVDRYSDSKQDGFSVRLVKD